MPLHMPRDFQLRRYKKKLRRNAFIGFVVLVALVALSVWKLKGLS